MTVNEFVNKHYQDIKDWLYNTTRGEKPYLFDDYVQEVLSIFIQHPKAQESIDTGTARYFIVRIGLNQWRSGTSPFHYQYRHSFYDSPEYETETETDDYDYTQDVQLKMIMDGIDKMYNDESTKYEAIMMIMYYTNNSNYSAVGRILKIPHTTVRKIVMRAITKLQKIIFNNDDYGKINGTYDDFSDSWSTNGNDTTQQTLSLSSQLIKAKYFGTA